jgi:hypothetical protein
MGTICAIFKKFTKVMHKDEAHLGLSVPGELQSLVTLF